MEKGKEKQKNINPPRHPSTVVFHSYKQKKDHALESVFAISQRKDYIRERERGSACVGGGEMSIPGKETERTPHRKRERRERAKRKNEGTGDPFRFYTTVNSNCTRWLMAFPFSLLFAKIPSYTSLISHSHANEDRSCNDILRWETPARWWASRGRGERSWRVAYNRFFFLEMGRKMQMRDRVAQVGQIKKLNVIFRWIFGDLGERGSQFLGRERDAAFIFSASADEKCGRPPLLKPRLPLSAVLFVFYSSEFGNPFWVCHSLWSSYIIGGESFSIGYIVFKLQTQVLLLFIELIKITKQTFAQNSL